jgi:hypothetical protein
VQFGRLLSFFCVADFPTAHFSEKANHMTELRDFVSDLLEREGAIVDVVEPSGLDVMAPEALRTRFGWPDFARLGFGTGAQTGSILIGLEDDWLDRLGTLLGERGRSAVQQIALPEDTAPPNDSERLIVGTLELPNAIWRLKAVELSWCNCLLLSFRYTAISDEKRDGIVWLAFNCTTGAVLHDELVAALRSSIDHADGWQAPTLDAIGAAGTMWPAEMIAARALPIVERLVRADLEPFLTAMQRRARRDRDRVHAYHEDMRNAAIAKLTGLERAPRPGGRGKKVMEEAAKVAEKSAAAIARERLRIATIEREYAAKLDDLRHNYALAVKVEWVQSLIVIAPVYRHNLLIKRRKGERTIAMDWHIVARRMEPAPCDCGESDKRARIVCDDGLHLTPAEGQSPCQGCGKAFCRACHPDTCPRCDAPIGGRSATGSRGSQLFPVR